MSLPAMINVSWVVLRFYSHYFTYSFFLTCFVLLEFSGKFWVNLNFYTDEL